MNRPPTIDDRLTAWLDQGPSTGPDDLLTTAHARARSMRQRPGWWLALRGDTMDTTWRARPVLTARLAFALLTALLIVALGATMVIVGSRLTAQPVPDDGPKAVTVVPKGGEAVLAFSAFDPGDGHGEIYTMRADGTDRRHVDRGWFPAWSPDGSSIAYFDGDWALKVADAALAPRTLVTTTGCHNWGAGPSWSPDSRFIVYEVYRGTSTDCSSVDTDLLQDLYVVPADGSSAGKRLLASYTASSVRAAWSPDGTRIAFMGTDGIESDLMLADVTDSAAPWGLTARRLSVPGEYVMGSWDFPRWSPDSRKIATIVIRSDTPAWHTAVVTPDGSSPPVVFPGTADVGVAEWSPDGSRLSVQRQRDGVAQVSRTDPYDGYLVDPDGGDPLKIESPVLGANWGGLQFSPDGTRVIGRSPSGPAKDLYSTSMEVITLDGSAEPVTVPEWAIGFGNASWQPVINPESPLKWATAMSVVASPTP